MQQLLSLFGVPAEIAILAIYLASDESKFVTEQTQSVDRGWVNK